MNDKIKKLSDKNDNLNPYIKEGNIYDDIIGVLDKHAGTVSTVSVVGVLELIKHELIKNA